MMIRKLPFFFLLCCLGWLGFSPVDDGSKIKWLDFAEALESNSKEPRKILVDVYTNWCGWCKRMDKITFGHPDIIKYVNKKFYAVKMNGEMKETVKIGDDEFNFVGKGRRGYHQLAVALMGGMTGYPTIVFLDEMGKRVQVAPGYHDPVKMDKMLRFYGENHYKKSSWPIFEKSYKSRIKKTAGTK